MALRVTVWNEYIHEKNEERIKKVYPKGIHGAIAEMLGKTTDFIIKTATLEEPCHGLTDEVLENTDVLIWWGHVAHKDVSDEIAEKVYSAHCTVEVINGELTGVITAKIIGELSDESMAKFTDYCVGQLSDGWGESLEQKYMRTEGGEINISFWSDDEAWALVPEDDYLSDNTQDMEMSM